MIVLKKVKSCLKPVVDFESNLESAQSNKWFFLKKYQSDNHTKQLTKVYRLSQTKIKQKISVSVKNVVALTFMYPIIKVFLL